MKQFFFFIENKSDFFFNSKFYLKFLNNNMNHTRCVCFRTNYSKKFYEKNVFSKHFSYQRFYAHKKKSNLKLCIEVLKFL